MTEIGALVVTPLPDPTAHLCAAVRDVPPVPLGVARLPAEAAVVTRGARDDPAAARGAAHAPSPSSFVSRCGLAVGFGPLLDAMDVKHLVARRTVPGGVGWLNFVQADHALKCSIDLEGQKDLTRYVHHSHLNLAYQLLGESLSEIQVFCRSLLGPLSEPLSGQGQPAL